MSTPAVSVVMPVYNGARFVRAAIDSVLRQTFPDFELVVVDDGSTDETPSLLAEAARADSRIRLVPHSGNRGVVAARNTAAAAARAPLVAVLDSDDLAMPDRLDRQVAFLANHPDVSILGGSVQLIDDKDQRGEVRRYPQQPGLAAWSMLFFNSVAHSTMMIRRELFASGYPAGAAEDYALLAPLSLSARIANLPDVLALYRAWPGSFTVQGWQRQEGHANEIVQRLVAQIIGETIPLPMAELLRGLSRNRYPHDPAEIRAAADLIRTLAAAYVARVARGRADVSEIKRDAGIRLWLLAALAARRSPGLSCALGVSATKLRPQSVFEFLTKAARQWSASRSRAGARSS